MMNGEEVPALSTSGQAAATEHRHRRKRRRSHTAKLEKRAMWVLYLIVQAGTLLLAFLIWYLVARV